MDRSQLRKNELRKKAAKYIDKTLNNSEKRNPFNVISCPHCHNRGRKNGKICPVCSGKRFLKIKEFIAKYS